MSAGASASCGSCASSPWLPSPCAGPHRTQTTVPDELGIARYQLPRPVGIAHLTWSVRHISSRCFPLRSRHAVRGALGTVARLLLAWKGHAGPARCTRAHIEALSLGSLEHPPTVAGLDLGRSGRDTSMVVPTLPAISPGSPPDLARFGTTPSSWTLGWTSVAVQDAGRVVSEGLHRSVAVVAVLRCCTVSIWKLRHQATVPHPDI